MELTHPVGIHAYDDTVVEVPLFTLLQWRSALKLEAGGMRHSRGSVAAHVRRFLKVPKAQARAWNARALSTYLQECIDDLVKANGPIVVGQGKAINDDRAIGLDEVDEQLGVK